MPSSRMSSGTPSTIASDAEAEKDALYDVAEHIASDLDSKVQVALEERVCSPRSHCSPQGTVLACSNLWL